MKGDTKKVLIILIVMAIAGAAGYFGSSYILPRVMNVNGAGDDLPEDEEPEPPDFGEDTEQPADIEEEPAEFTVSENTVSENEVHNTYRPAEKEDLDNKSYAETFTGGVSKLNDRLLYTISKDDNVLYSPYSIYTALMVLANGAQGETADNIARAMGYSDIDKMNEEIKEYRTNFPSDEGITLKNANLLTLMDTLVLSDTYKNETEAKLKDIYDAKVLIFSPEDRKKTVEDIKEFISEKTDGHIPDYEIAPSEATIINTVYFDGMWATPFSSETQKKTFHNKSGSETTTDFMYKKLETGYLNEDGIEALSYSYQHDLDMIFIKTSEESNVSMQDIYIQNNTEELFSKILSNNRIVRCYIPMIDMDIMNDKMKDVLDKCGYGAFLGIQNYEGFTDNSESPLCINEIKHRAKINIDTKGTKASAVTEIGMTLGAALPSQTPEVIPEFTLDRPYIFVIRDRSNGMLLFTGVVNDI